MFSADRLKSFASVEGATSAENENWDDNFEGDLMTIKGPLSKIHTDFRELDTIRPLQRKTDSKSVVDAKAHGRKKSAEKHHGAPIQRPRSSNKDKGDSKFALPSRPAAIYREQSTDDYSDLLVGNEKAFDRKLDVIKVCRSIAPLENFAHNCS
jgi:hypothetical protein